MAASSTCKWAGKGTKWTLKGTKKKNYRCRIGKEVVNDGEKWLVMQCYQGSRIIDEIEMPLWQGKAKVVSRLKVFGCRSLQQAKAV